MTVSLASLAEFTAMRDGTHDTIYKTYDLLYLSNPNRVRRALYRLGLFHDELSMGLDALRSTLSLHVRTPATREAVAELLSEWFVWDRIRAGELRTWKYRAGARGKNVRATVSKSGIVTAR